MDDYQVDEGKSSKFNAAVLGTQRISKILDLINFCKNNLTAFNGDYHDVNFNIWFSNLDILYAELEGFMKKKERDSCIKIRESIQKMVLKYPIIEEIRKHPTQKPEKTINRYNLDIIRKAVERYEWIIKRYGIKYKVIASTEDDFFSGGL